jgi:hypothetical protein
MKCSITSALGFELRKCAESAACFFRNSAIDNFSRKNVQRKRFGRHQLLLTLWFHTDLQREAGIRMLRCVIEI